MKGNEKWRELMVPRELMMLAPRELMVPREEWRELMMLAQ